MARPTRPRPPKAAPVKKKQNEHFEEFTCRVDQVSLEWLAGYEARKVKLEQMFEHLHELGMASSEVKDVAAAFGKAAQAHDLISRNDNNIFQTVAAKERVMKERGLNRFVPGQQPGTVHNTLNYFPGMTEEQKRMLEEAYLRSTGQPAALPVPATVVDVEPVEVS